MSENINNQNGQQQPTTPTPEASGGQGGERTFTHSELDRIVQDRLARDRASRPAASDRERDLVEREQKLAAREAYIECWEHLKDKHLPIVPRSTSMSHQYGGEGSDNDAIADAFKPKGRR